MSVDYIKCECCNRIGVAYDYIQTNIYIVGIKDLDFNICDDCIDEIGLIQLDEDANLSDEEINMILDGESLYKCIDKQNFIKKIVNSYTEEIYKLSKKIKDLEGYGGKDG